MNWFFLCTHWHVSAQSLYLHYLSVFFSVSICKVSSENKVSPSLFVFFFSFGFQPDPPPSFSEAAVAWLFPSESSVTLRLMSSGRDGERRGRAMGEVWWRRSETETLKKCLGGRRLQTVQDNDKTVHPQEEHKASSEATTPSDIIFPSSATGWGGQNWLACSVPNKLLCLF